MHDPSSGCSWKDGFQVLTVALNVLNNQPQTAYKGWSSSFVTRRSAKTSHSSIKKLH
jgi:hypothetical protein